MYDEELCPPQLKPIVIINFSLSFLSQMQNSIEIAFLPYPFQMLG